MAIVIALFAIVALIQMLLIGPALLRKIGKFIESRPNADEPFPPREPGDEL